VADAAQLQQQVQALAKWPPQRNRRNQTASRTMPRAKQMKTIYASPNQQQVINLPLSSYSAEE
jgi:hypothetical protein